MKRFGLVAIMSAMTAFAALSGTPAQAAEACGEKGQKACPLQGWMDKNLQAPMEAGKFDVVATNLKKVAKMAPDAAWEKGDKPWGKFIKEGVAAANAGDVKALKKSCKGCHKAFRKNYKKQFRTKPIKG